MTINEMLTEIESYQHKLNLADDYLFNIVEFDPDEIKAYRAKTAPESAYQGTLTQIKRLYLLSLSPEELLKRIKDAQQKLVFQTTRPSKSWASKKVSLLTSKPAACQP